MRILYYNWVDPLDDENRGGGVTVYQQNLMRSFAGQGDVTAHFLSAGTAHELPMGAPRWEQQRFGVDEGRETRFELVNSGVLAPAHASFGDPAQVEHVPTRDVFFDFIAKNGPYDVVHFNNLEGLPASVLALKEHWPDTRVVLSLHNYYPVCPQVNLWYQERETCDDFNGGRNCVDCLEQRPNARMQRMSRGLAYRLKSAGLRPGSTAYEAIYRGAYFTGRRLARVLAMLRGGRTGAGEVSQDDPGAPFAERRAAMVDLINTHCDRVLCVSQAVSDLAMLYGIDPALVETSYIGTREAARFAETAPRGDLPRGDGTLRLAYLGYMRRDKGFYFLLDALESLPADLAARLHLVVAARRGESATMARLDALKARLGGFDYHDGYTHSGLDELLGGVDVGVVPVLWHDNLPQVAIEMHARHIPLLCADMGGAQELSGATDMTFRAGDQAAFHSCIAALLAGEVDMETYWQNAHAPTEMGDHLQSLIRAYSG